MENIEFENGEIEGHFGLILREKNDHNNYISIKFEDLDKIVQYYDDFKKSEIISKIKNDITITNQNQNNKNELTKKIIHEDLRDEEQMMRNRIQYNKNEIKQLQEKIIMIKKSLMDSELTNKKEEELKNELLYLDNSLIDKSYETDILEKRIEEIRRKINELS